MPLSQDERQSLTTFLESLGLPRYVDVFDEHDVSIDVLTMLTEGEMQELGVSLGHRKRILLALRSRPASGADVSTESEPEAGPEAAELRQVTSVFIDLVGSTKLAAELDPEDMAGLLRRYHATCEEVVQRHGGHVAQFLGDGVLAFFGYPTTFEDAAVRAVNAALDATRAVARLVSSGRTLQARVGVATGIVVAGRLLSAGMEQELSAIGKSVNLAARLQGLAPPGGVVISASTRRLLGEYFELEPLEPQELPGFDEPIQAFVAVRAGQAADRFAAFHAADLKPLFGRDDELDVLLGTWQDVAGGTGRCVLVSGEAGIGKSRLVRALLDALRLPSSHCLRFACSPYHINSALWPVVDHYVRAADWQPDDSSAERVEKLRGTLHGEPSQIGQALPLLVDLLSIEQPQPRVDGLSAKERQRRTLDAVLDQLEVVARTGPTLVVLEDAHWVDPTSLDLFSETVERIGRGAAILFLATARPQFTSPWSGRTGFQEVRLARLGRASAADIMRAVAGKPLPADVVDAITNKTDGVPLFVEELTKTLLESGILEDRGAEFHVTRPLEDLSIPATLQDSLAARLDRLDAAKPVAQFASAIGREFTYALLAAAPEHQEGGLLEALSRLIASELVVQYGAPPNSRYVFTHALIRDAAYQSMLRDQRRRCHRTIAHSLAEHFTDVAATQPELLGQHFVEADDVLAAIPWFQRAGDLAGRRSANREAVRHLRTAIDLLNQVPQDVGIRSTELDLRTMMSGPLIALKGYVSDELEENYERAWWICETDHETQRAFPVLYGQWVIPYVHGDMPMAARQGERFLTLAEKSGDVGLRMVGHRLFGAGLTWRGDPVEGVRHLEQALSLYVPGEHDRLAFEYSQHMGVAARAHLCFAYQAIGRFDAARQTAADAVSEARRVEHFNSIAYALCFTSLLHMLREEPDDVEPKSQELLRLSREKDAAYWALWAEAMLGWVQVKRGDVEAGLAAIRKPVGSLEGQRAWVWVPQAQLAECEGHARLGQAETAAAREAFARRLILDVGQEYYRPELHRVAARRLQLAGADAESVEAELRAGVRAARDKGAFGHEMPVAVDLARHLMAHNAAERAREVLSAVRCVADEGLDTRARVEFDALRGELNLD